MKDKTTVYCKQTGEPSIPVTARIDWLPDGTIKPCLYWTPDGSCYKINHVYEMTPLAFLKDRGEGLRFKVRAVLKETPEPYPDSILAQHETYLYLNDNFFCGKNIIDERYDHDLKEFIPVTLDVFQDGEYELVYFEVHGTRYMVEKTIVVEPRGSFYAGGIGLLHKIKARQINSNEDEGFELLKSVCREAALYFEINKWFVAVNAA